MAQPPACFKALSNVFKNKLFGRNEEKNRAIVPFWYDLRISFCTTTKHSVMKSVCILILLATLTGACSRSETTSDPEHGTVASVSNDPVGTTTSGGLFETWTRPPQIASTQEEQNKENKEETSNTASVTDAKEETTTTAHTASQPTVAEEEAQPKKKMSNTVKGLIIGTGVGIVTGAATSKDNRVKGAVVGGMVGAAVGGTTGAVIDRRQKQK